MKIITVAALCLFLASCLSACNTTQGIGQDIQGAGSTLEEMSKDAQNAIKHDSEK